MPYRLNPHRHVKIWLSTDPDIFLNSENQLRLVKMRAKNPDDTIHMVYAKKLLSENALSELTDFCKKHTIIPVAIEDNVLPKCVNNECEHNLAAIYEREINTLNDGGSVAAASDILRWLSPVYSLGIYSDFDVVIDTTKLAPIITVDTPILLNLGSIEISIDGLPNKSDLEGIALNNDSIAVIGDDPLATKSIQKMQQRIYNAYLNPEIYMEYMAKQFTDVCLYVNQQLHDNGMTSISVASQHVYLSTEALPATTLAGGLELVKPDPIALRKAILNGALKNTFTVDKNLRQEILNLADQTGNKQYAKTMSDTELAEMLKENYCHLLMINTVSHTTGPKSILMGLFEHYALPRDKINTQIKPYSFQYYGLNEAFSTPDSFDFHQTIQDFLKKLKGVEIGDIGDQSWLKKGAEKVIQRQEKMHQAAATIQRTYKIYKEHRETFFYNNQASSELESKLSTTLKIQ